LPSDRGDRKMLPIEAILTRLKDSLHRYAAAVLVAPPGAGKTTRVPLALLEEAWLAGQRILVLEPRRLATRAAACYMAASLGERVGETVGYRIKLEARVGPRTRIEVITEGILTRMLQSDAALSGVGMVIFDEFHERSIHADLGLALCLESQSILRPDLRLLVMSATLDAEPVAKMMGEVPILVSEGRLHPVETRYLDRAPEGRIESLVCNAVLAALNNHQGDILAFLPGAGEIRRVKDLLSRAGVGSLVHIAPLFSGLDKNLQDAAMLPSPPGQRKVVLATAIAETSITIEGIQVVIDCGLMRIPRFSPRTGMTRLETVQVSRLSADQRRGRAGRLGPGVCYRLWSKQADLRLALKNIPEICEADLAWLMLELAAWGIVHPQDLHWLDQPPLAACNQARVLLVQMGALSSDGTITLHGKQMVEAGLHPRLGHMILRAVPLGLGGLACELAALISQMEELQRITRQTDSDLRQLLAAMRQAGSLRGSGDGLVETAGSRAVLRRIAIEIRHWQREFKIPASGSTDIEDCGILLAFAYPDRIAQRRADGRFLLSSGRGASFNSNQSLAVAPYLVAVELDDQGIESRIFLAVPVEPEDLESNFGDEIQEAVRVAWDTDCQAVRGRRQKRLGALLLKECPATNLDPSEILQALLQGIREEGLALLPWTKSATQLVERLQFMHYTALGWPDMSNEALSQTCNEWLAPFLYGITSRDELQKIDLTRVLLSRLTWEQRQQIEEYAPTHILVPSGQRVPINYGDPAAPVIAVRLQEMFGLTETPCIARGEIRLTLQLLSPAHRPVQVTQDLASFWRSTYFEVRKELMGRYPKHDWPNDPLNAKPACRVRVRY